MLAPSIGFAGGHAGLGGHGTGVVTNTEAMQGTTGGLVKQTTQDVWIWDNPPEDFPAASNVTCNQFIAFSGTPQPIGGAIVCRSIDPDGDVSLNNGTFQPDGTVLPTIVAATRKMGAICWCFMDWENRYPTWRTRLSILFHASELIR